MKAIVLVIAMATVAAADPIALVPYTAKAGSLSLPRGWTIRDNGASIEAQEDPRRSDGAAVIVILQASGVTQTEDQLLDAVASTIAKDVKVATRGALPGGRGHTLLADGASSGTPVRLGAVAYTDGGAGVVCVFAARADAFAALGGLGVPHDIVASVKLTTPQAPAHASSPLDDVNRGTKRTGLADLPPDRASLAPAQLQRVWTRISGHVVGVTDQRTTTEIRGHYDSHMDSDMFEFFKDGNYTLTSVYESKNSGCNSAFRTVEHGSYTFDGRTLVMTTKDAATTGGICGGQSHTKAIAQLPAPRTYAIGLAADGYLVMIGPSCSAARDARCFDHARWEMKPGAAK